MSENINIILQAQDQASSVIASASSGINGSLRDVQTQSNTLAQSMQTNSQSMKGVAAAEQQVNGGAKDLATGFGGVEAAGQRVTASQQQATSSAKDLAVGFSGVATSGFSLYMSYERVQNSAVMLDRANLNVQKSTQSLTVAQQASEKAADAVQAAQDKYNAAIKTYGDNSPQAAKAAQALTDAQTAQQDATSKLQIATDAQTVSQERADMAQRNYNDSITSAAVMAIPQVITMISSLSKAFSALNDIDFSRLWSSLENIGSRISGLISGTSGLNSGLSGLGTAGGGGAGGTGGVGGTASMVAVGTGVGAAALAGAYGLTELSKWIATQNKVGLTFAQLYDQFKAVGFGPQFLEWASQNNALPGMNAANYVTGKQGGGWVGLSGPEVVRVGEAEPELIVPKHMLGNAGASNVFNVTINVEGSVDERVMQNLENRLQSIILKASSSGVPSTSKSITFSGGSGTSRPPTYRGPVR